MKLLRLTHRGHDSNGGKGWDELAVVEVVATVTREISLPEPKPFKKHYLGFCADAIAGIAAIAATENLRAGNWQKNMVEMGGFPASVLRHRRRVKLEKLTPTSHMVAY
jgi:hypothetical protein